MGRFFSTCLAAGRLYSGIKGLWAFAVWLFFGGGGALVIAALGGPWILGPLAVAAVIIIVLLYLGTPGQRGVHTPGYLKWYALPIRRISWEFDNYLGMSAHQGGDITMGVMQFVLRVNYGSDLVPIKGCIVSLNTGQEIAIELKGPEGYLPISSIGTIPAKTKIYGHAVFARNPLPDSEFLRQFSGFDFRFECESARFERRFSRLELEFVIDNFRRYSNPEPPRRIVARKD